MEGDDLYGLPLDRFVPERDQRVRALRAESQRPRATELAGRRKPSVAAWAVNQLVRTQAAATAELFAAGDALRAAQAALLTGQGDGASMRSARERERGAVDQLLDSARGLLSSGGGELGTAVVDRVAETLHAAALDEVAREQVSGGCLERELRHVGLGGDGVFGDLAAAPVGTGPPAVKRAAPRRDRAAREPAQTPGGKPGNGRRDEAARERAQAERREREQAVAREAERRAAAVKAARAAEAAARRQVDRARRAVDAAAERRARAALALDRAEEELSAAEAQAAAADAEHRRASAAREDAER